MPRYGYGRPYDFVRDVRTVQRDLKRTVVDARLGDANNWTSFAGSYLGGWADDVVGVTGKYRTLDEHNILYIIGRVANSAVGGVSGTSSVYQFPAGTVATLQSRPIVIIAATNAFAASASTPRLQLDTTGLLSLVSLPAGTTTVEFDVLFSADA